MRGAEKGSKDGLRREPAESERAKSAGLDSTPIVYCLVPADLAERAHEALRRHFREQGIEVVVELRGRERRSGAERRADDHGPPRGGEERRRIHAETGRRVGERRSPQVGVDAPELPRTLRRYADRLTFVERLEPTGEKREDEDSARLVARFQAGDQDAFAHLYTRYFDRVYGYLRIVFREVQEAEDVTQQVFMHVFMKLGEYERRRQPFRAWLFVVVRNHAINRLRKLGRLEVEDPATLDRRREHADSDAPDPAALGWITDRDLLLFVERLPLPQRQALTMRYLLGMTTSEIAAVMGRRPNDVSKLQHRALAFLRERLAAVSTAPRHERPARCRNRPKQAVVLRERRFALFS
jgi:RNA polymerase sigma-70 factor (ECF subfamily)